MNRRFPFLFQARPPAASSLPETGGGKENQSGDSSPHSKRPSRGKSRRPMMRSYWLAGLGFLVCGCGLADYEQEMLKAERRQKYLEEENRLLDSHVQMPTRPDKSGAKLPVAN